MKQLAGISEPCAIQAESTTVASAPTHVVNTGAPHHVNMQDCSGKTTLMNNCAKGLTSTVEELSYDADIDVNLADNEGNTALHHAAQAGHSGVLQMLVEQFPNLAIDQVNRLGQTALIKAAIQGRVNCAKLLLEAGADPYLRDYSRQFCSLEWAEYVGRTECAHMIAHFMLDLSSQTSSTAGMRAASKGCNSLGDNGSSMLKPRRVGNSNNNSSRRRSPAASAAKQSHYHRSLPTKKFSDTASNNFKQVACLAAIPLIGGTVNGELPAVVRPRVRSAPPIPTFKITTPQQTYNNNDKSQKDGSRTRGRPARGKGSKRGTDGYRGTPLMAAVVAHCHVRPSSSCA